MKRFLFLALAGLLAFSSARGAESIHVILKGNKQGVIKGELSDGTIEALAFQHEIYLPQDPSTGLPSGFRRYKPVTIVKPIDKSSPPIFAAAVMNEAVTVTLKFYRKSPGQSVATLYYTITLSNAMIVGVREWKPNTRDLSADRAGDLEEVSIFFRKISWAYADGSIIAEDDWGSSG